MRLPRLSSRTRITDADAIELFGLFTVPRFASALVAVVSVWALSVADALPFDPRPLVTVVIPVMVVISGTALLAVRQGIKPRALLQLQTYLDLVAVFAGIVVTGGARSPFLPMVVLVVYSAGVVSTTSGAIVGTLAVGSVAALAVAGGGVAGIFSLSVPELVSFTVFGSVLALTLFQSRYFVSRLLDKEDEMLKLKDEFVFRTVHDVRSPATTIALVLDKYSDPKYAKALPDFKADSGAVSSALRRIDALVTELLRIGEEGEKALEVVKERVDITSVVRDAADTLSPQLSMRRLAFRHDVSGPTFVVADPRRLRNAVDNLIGNAIKYNRDGGSITVSHHVTERGVETEFADTGIGISEASVAKLFTAYFRGDVGAEIPGTGLGLYSTKKVIERMSGTIAVHSVKDVGTTFTVTLPSAPVQQSSPR